MSTVIEMMENELILNLINEGETVSQESELIGLKRMKTGPIWRAMSDQQAASTCNP